MDCSLSTKDYTHQLLCPLSGLYGLNAIGNFTAELLAPAVELPITWGDRAVYYSLAITKYCASNNDNATRTRHFFLQKGKYLVAIVLMNVPVLLIGNIEEYYHISS